MNILFVCRYNRFRSKVAEAFFNKYNKNKKNKAKSAGMIRGSPISNEIRMAAAKFGIKVKGKPQGLSTELLKWHDIAVIVARDVPEEVFRNGKYRKRVIAWGIGDTSNDRKRAMKRIISEIEKRVIKLVGELG